MKGNTNIALNTDKSKLFLQKSQPQISCLPGVSVKQKHRYRVILGGEILGDKLSLNEALKLAGLGGVA